jgi:hypothetical protein
MDAVQEVARLKQLLAWEQNNHRAFRAEVYSDPEFSVIIERRGRERMQRRTEQYISRLLDDVEVLEVSS